MWSNYKSVFVTSLPEHKLKELTTVFEPKTIPCMISRLFELGFSFRLALKVWTSRHKFQRTDGIFEAYKLKFTQDRGTYIMQQSFKLYIKLQKVNKKAHKTRVTF